MTFGFFRPGRRGRLERIEEITGVELRDGIQRLSLHVGIKLARLAGIIR